MSRKLSISLIAAAALLLPVGSVRAAVTIGSDLSATPVNGDACSGPPACTAGNTAITMRQVASPFDGVVVRWRLKASNTCLCPGTGVRLRVVHPVAGGAYIGTNSSVTHVITDGPVATHIFKTGQPIQKGDLIALDIGFPSNNFVTNVGSGGTLARWQPRLADGEKRAPTTTLTTEMTLNADIEPDADCDGLGDESQDPLVLPSCLPPAPSPVAAGIAELVGGVVKTKGKSISLTFSCPATAGDCSGNSLQLRSTKPVSFGKASVAKAKRIAVGSASFSVPKGGSQAVTVPLTKRARQALRQRKKLPVNATITGGSTVTTAALRIKLK
jgi:hypothetical protein